MKRICIAMFTGLIVFSCSKDDEEKMLATPTLEWTAVSVQGSALEITISISSSEELPAGNLTFNVDGTQVNTFSAIKGSKMYTTGFTFEDTKTHQASLVYSFTDERTKINKTIAIKKSEQEIVQKSSRNDWIEL